MPQMSPMSWLTLMIIFIITLIMINSMMYFNKKYNNKMIMSEKKDIKMNWKW